MTGVNDETISRQARAQLVAAHAAALFGSGHYVAAAKQFRSALSLWPEHADLRYNLAMAAWAAGDLQTTRDELTRVVALNPAYAKAHDAVAGLLINADDAAGASLASADALRLEPNNPEFILTSANVREMQGRYEEAWQRAISISREPSISERAALLLTRIAKPLGYESEAIRFTRSLLATPAANSVDRRRLHFALAALLDKIGRYDEAFAEATIAHAINRPAYDPVARRREFDARINHWTKQRIDSVRTAAASHRRIVFIVGMPRSGTSLIEQILSRHPDVYAAGELSAIPRVAAAIDRLGRPYPQSLEGISRADADRLASQYLGEVAALDATRPVVTDKLPLNFMYLELIDRLLPSAKVIHCVRDYRDTCLSNFMTDFATPYDFASTIADLGELHRMYVQIMSHWKQVLTVPVLDVEYESVVDDLELNARRILQFLELPWDSRCLRFHESDRPVITASKNQVKRPLYRSSVGRWKHYAKHLTALQP